MTAPRARRWGGFLLRLAASAAVLAVVVAVVDFDRALEGISRLRPLPWLGALAAFVALHVLSALKWRYLLSLAGARIAPRVAFSCHAAGLFGNLCLPSLIGGDVVRAGLAMRSPVSRSALLVGSAVDRIGDFTALLALSLLALPFADVGADTPLRALPTAAAIVAAGGLAGLAAVRWVVRSRVVRRLPRKAARATLKGARALRAMRRSPVRSALGWSACLGIQALFVLVNAALGRSMGLDLDLSLWFLLWPMAKIVAMLPVSFGGLGVREAAFAALVSPFGPESLAVAQSLVWQSVLIVGGLLAGAFWSASPRLGAPEPRAP